MQHQLLDVTAIQATQEEEGFYAQHWKEATATALQDQSRLKCARELVQRCLEGLVEHHMA